MANQYEYEYLGFAMFSTQEEMMTTPFLINVSPLCFDNFLLSASTQTSDDIYNGNNIVLAICEFTGENDITSTFRSINISCDFLYHLSFRDNNNLIQWTNLTPSNYASFLSTLSPSNQLSLSLVSATFEMLEFNHLEYYDEVGVDIEVYYSWEEDVNSPTKILRLQLQQEPIPLLPIRASTPSSGLYFLGYDVLDHMFNKLEFVRYFDANFWNSFPETSVATRLRDRFWNGFGIRAANVYTPRTIIHGLQLKMDRFGSQPDVVTLHLGSILDIHTNFYGKTILVYYYWTGDSLELVMMTGGID